VDCVIFQEFWDNLIKRRDLVGETRWPKGLYDTPPRAGLIKGIDKFDAQFFQFTDTEVGHSVFIPKFQ
jgi:acyl transferase domain-containing protein